jgi:SAM-dependent methyltransferase
MSSRVRSRLLQTMFHLLYTRLGFLHEVAGRTAYGPAWNGRRKHVIPTKRSRTLLDLGCGEGRLLSSIGVRQVFAVGVEPSRAMARRAGRRLATVVLATAQALPLQDGSVGHVVATYPGPWIIDPQTWDEIARVTEDGGRVDILLGGDIVRGRGSILRRRLLRLAYGGTNGTGHLPTLGNDQVIGEYVTKDDEWGTAVLWCGMRVSTKPERSSTDELDVRRN